LLVSDSKGEILKGNLTNKSRWDSLKVLSDNDADVDDPDMFVVKHDFTPIGPHQLAIKRGDKIHVKGYNEAGEWCEGETGNGAIGWIPTSYIARLDSLEKHSWYHGLVTREEADQRLGSCINGTFLIRESESRPGQYSMGLRYNGRTHHYKISSGVDKDCYYISPNAKFTTLRLLVHHHSNNLNGLVTTLQYPAVNPSKPPVYNFFHEVDEWEVKRNDLVMGVKLGTGHYNEVYKATLKLIGKTVVVKTCKVL